MSAMHESFNSGLRMCGKLYATTNSSFSLSLLISSSLDLAAIFSFCSNSLSLSLSFVQLLFHPFSLSLVGLTLFSRSCFNHALSSTNLGSTERSWLDNKRIKNTRKEGKRLQTKKKEKKPKFLMIGHFSNFSLQKAKNVHFLIYGVNLCFIDCLAGVQT